jgi:hypothetical protein
VKNDFFHWGWGWVSLIRLLGVEKKGAFNAWGLGSQGLQVGAGT